MHVRLLCSECTYKFVTIFGTDFRQCPSCTVAYDEPTTPGTPSPASIGSTFSPVVMFERWVTELLISSLRWSGDLILCMSCQQQPCTQCLMGGGLHG